MGMNVADPVVEQFTFKSHVGIQDTPIHPVNWIHNTIYGVLMGTWVSMNVRGGIVIHGLVSLGEESPQVVIEDNRIMLRKKIHGEAAFRLR